MSAQQATTDERDGTREAMETKVSQEPVPEATHLKKPSTASPPTLTKPSPHPHHYQGEPA